jgi:hypothetical protein
MLSLFYIVVLDNYNIHYQFLYSRHIMGYEVIYVEKKMRSKIEFDFITTYTNLFLNYGTCKIAMTFYKQTFVNRASR